jgi:hypothetical protein
MTGFAQRIADRALRMFLPERDAGACACSPADGYYQYRCNLPTGQQRRWCSVNCNCVPNCGSWVTIFPGGCY